MLEFSLNSFAEKIHYGKTKDYFQEVLSSYQNGNYRSAVVMLWSVAVCDIVYKLQYLVDLYDDKSAKSILIKLAKLQEEDPKSSAWEIQLIEDTYNKTSLLDSSEYENLRYLQKQRHLSAHPILNADKKLHKPNKDTVRSLIRNTLEGLLIKPPFYTKKITDEFLVNIAEAAPFLDTDVKVKRYVESRYLDRIKPEVELYIYKTLWKFVFNLNNENCSKNRDINFQVLEVITNRHREDIIKKISGNKDYYSNILPESIILNYLTFYLSKNSNFYELLNEDVKIKIQHHVQNNHIGRIYGWFLHNSLKDYYNNILSLIDENPHSSFTERHVKFLLKISDTVEWENLVCCIFSAYYCVSPDYDKADSRFQQAISPNIDLFDKEALLFLIKRIESNDQVYRRDKAIVDHKQIQQKLVQLYGEEFDLKPYPHFKGNVIGK